MIVAIDVFTLKVAIGWMILGLFIYFGYSRHHSKLD
jgi:APA family basic amino acid/polyamine antiporter